MSAPIYANESFPSLPVALQNTAFWPANHGVQPVGLVWINGNPFLGSPRRGSWPPRCQWDGALLEPFYAPDYGSSGWPPDPVPMTHCPVCGFEQEM